MADDKRMRVMVLPSRFTRSDESGSLKLSPSR